MANSPYIDGFLAGVMPPPDYDVDEWADAERYLSTKTSAEPGRWRTSRVPYAQEPMKCLSRRHPARKVVLMWPSQSAKTEVGLNFIGLNVVYNPGPMMVVQPTIAMAQKFSKQRVKSLIEDSPTVFEAFGGKHNARDGSNTVLEKEFTGGSLTMVGSKSASALASMPQRDIFADEVDRFDRSAGVEGSPLDLAIARTTNFPDSKILITSTPTIKGQSVVEEEFLKTNQMHLYVPCPHCKGQQILQWDRLDYKRHGEDHPVYICEHCDGEIEEHRKLWMLKNREWRAHNPDAPADAWGFWMNGLYSPFPGSAWPALVREWKSAQDNPMKLRVFFNTRLSQPWENKGETPDWEKLYLRRERYIQGTVPEGALVLTAGVDVQQDRLEVEVVGWGEGLESWSVDYVVIMGAPHEESTWEKLEELRRRKFPHELGEYLQISAMAVDSGYASSDVYRYCRQHHPSQVMAIKGRDNLAIPVGPPKKVDYSQGGKVINSGAVIRHLGVDVLKSELYGWLAKYLPDEGEETPFGWCHFPEYGREYFEQLCAEKLVAKEVRGRLSYTFEKIRKRNEALDCRIYARAAAITLEIDRYTEDKWESLRRRAMLTEESIPVKNTESDYSNANRTRSGRRKGSWSY
jgi:phage terminase large subunit GpA-like protein